MSIRSYTGRPIYRATREPRRLETKTPEKVTLQLPLYKRKSLQGRLKDAFKILGFNWELD